MAQKIISCPPPPVGTIICTTSSTSPSATYGGTWERYGQGRVLVSASDTDTDFKAGKTGGEKTHVLTVDEMPKHRHEVRKHATMQGGGSWDVDKLGGAQYQDAITPSGYTQYTGGGKAHNNLPPYIAVYMWRRTA